MINENEFQYFVLEKEYLKNNNRTLSEDNMDLFTLDWFNSTNVKLKLDILIEANKNNIKVFETELYKKHFETDIV